MKFNKLLLAVAAVLVPLASFAQTTSPGEPDPSRVRVRLGPLYLNPSLALTNAGVDNNVFNEPDQAAPKRDFTMTVTPATDLWLRFGRTWFSGTLKEDLVYYHQYASERSANNSYKVNWFIPLNRLILNGGVDFLNTRERPGFEIDARSQRHEFGYNGSVEVRTLSRTFIGVKGSSRKVDFDKAAVFLNKSLQYELNRRSREAAVTARLEVTPLTNLTFDVTRLEDRFEFSPLRDSDSTQIRGGLKFDPFALLRGSATFGYRIFKPLTPGLASYEGPTAAVDLAYSALGSTTMRVQFARDVQYSYDVLEPYYVQTGFDASIGQQLFGPVDIVGRIGGARLVYRGRTDTVSTVAERTDHVRSYGGGVGYHLGRDLRIGVNADQQHRESLVELRQYNGLRYGMTVTYGF